MLRLKSFTRCSSKSANVERRNIFPMCAVKVGAATVAPFTAVEEWRGVFGSVPGGAAWLGKAVSVWRGVLGSG